MQWFPLSFFFHFCTISRHSPKSALVIESILTLFHVSLPTKAFILLSTSLMWRNCSRLPAWCFPIFNIFYTPDPVCLLIAWASSQTSSEAPGCGVVEGKSELLLVPGGIFQKTRGRCAVSRFARKGSDLTFEYAMGPDMTHDSAIVTRQETPGSCMLG